VAGRGAERQRGRGKIKGEDEFRIQSAKFEVQKIKRVQNLEWKFRSEEGFPLGCPLAHCPLRSFL
jgi:hypothetical protein